MSGAILPGVALGLALTALVVFVALLAIGAALRLPAWAQIPTAVFVVLPGIALGATFLAVALSGWIAR